MRWMPQQHERNALSFGYRKFSNGREVLTAKINIRVQHQRVRAGDGADASVRAPYPRNDGAVVKAHNELHAHAHLTASADDHTNASASLLRGGTQSINVTAPSSVS